MAQGKSQRLRPKRRRLGKTDYHRRMRLLRSGAPRAVVRVSNTQVTCQLISYNPGGDSIIESVNGKALVESYSWPSGSSSFNNHAPFSSCRKSSRAYSSGASNWVALWQAARTSEPTALKR